MKPGNSETFFEELQTFFTYILFKVWSKKASFNSKFSKCTLNQQIHFLEQSHHLPDLTSLDQVITLLHLLTIIILGPILYQPFYFSPHTITNGMFQAWANGQEQALAILQHINSHNTFYIDKREVPFQPIVHAFLSHQIRYLVKQVWLEEQTQILNHANRLSSEQFIQEIAALFSESSWLLGSLARHRRFKRPADSYEWYDKSNYTVLAHDKWWKMVSMVSSICTSCTDQQIYQDSIYFQKSQTIFGSEGQLTLPVI